MSDAGNAFILQARSYLKSDYLPKIERCLETLTDENMWWRANEGSNSIGNLILHLSGNAKQWIVCGVGGARDKRERQLEFDARNGPSKDALLTTLRQTLDEVDQTLAKVTSDKLLEKLRIQECDVTALEAIFHVVEHFSMHSGQIILLTKMLTQKDMGFYDFSTGAPITTWKE